MRAYGIVLFIATSVVAGSASALDDAEVLSRRVPGQSYYVGTGNIAALQSGKALWGIPLYACDPATLTITKFLEASAPAPYAIRISTRSNEPISEISFSGGRRLPEIHLLAASLKDAIKMRRALIKEIQAIQRKIELRQGSPPGYLESVARRDMQRKTPNQAMQRTTR